MVVRPSGKWWKSFFCSFSTKTLNSRALTWIDDKFFNLPNLAKHSSSNYSMIILIIMKISPLDRIINPSWNKNFPLFSVIAMWSGWFVSMRMSERNPWGRQPWRSGKQNSRYFSIIEINDFSSQIILFSSRIWQPTQWRFMCEMMVGMEFRIPKTQITLLLGLSSLLL